MAAIEARPAAAEGEVIAIGQGLRATFAFDEAIDTARRADDTGEDEDYTPCQGSRLAWQRAERGPLAPPLAPGTGGCRFSLSAWASSRMTPSARTAVTESTVID